MKLKELNKSVNPVHKLKCHCGSVQIELNLPKGIVNPVRCDCSICRMRGAINASVKLADLRVIQGADKLNLYQFNTMTAKHYFCSVCGIYTHHQQRSHPDQFAYNVACLEGINPYLLDEIPYSDGINHSCDRDK